MSSITVWTKQHENIAEELENTGRYIAKKEYVLQELDEHAPLVLEAYDWLVKNTSITQKPDDAEYPIWIYYAPQRGDGHTGA